MRLSPRSGVLLALLLAAAVVGGLPALAQMPFASFGARPAGLGGAAVALTDDPSGFIDNPALLSPQGGVWATSLGVGSVSTNGFVSHLDGVTGRSRAELAGGSAEGPEVRASLAGLASPGTAVLGDSRYGIVAASSGWGLAVVQTGWSSAVARTDLVHVAAGTDPATSFLANDSRIAFRALTLQDIAVTRVFGLFSGCVIGVTGHYLRGTAGVKEESAFTTDVGRLETFVRRGASGGAERTRSRFSWDVGAEVTIGFLRLGGVMKGVNRPQFPFEGASAPPEDAGTSVVVGRQTRVGAMAAIPGTRLVLAADVDLSKNETLADSLPSRNVGGGLEIGIGAFAVRGGASVNVEAPNRPLVWSGGLGFISGTFRAEVSATYRSNDGALGGVVSIRAGI